MPESTFTPPRKNVRFPKGTSYPKDKKGWLIKGNFYPTIWKEARELPSAKLGKTSTWQHQSDCYYYHDTDKPQQQVQVTTNYLEHAHFLLEAMLILQIWRHGAVYDSRLDQLSLTEKFIENNYKWSIITNKDKSEKQYRNFCQKKKNYVKKRQIKLVPHCF